MSKFTDTIKPYLPKWALGKQSTNTPAHVKEDTKKRASGRIKPRAKRSVTYEIKDIKQAFTLAFNPEQPNRTLLYNIYDYILDDSQLYFQIYIVALKKITVEPFGLYSKGKLDEDTTKLLKKKWFEILIKYIFEVEFFGFRLVELVVNTDKSIEIELIENQNVCPEFKIIWLGDAWSKPNIPYEGLEDDLSLLFFGDKKDLGSLRKIAYDIIYKFYSRSDWSRASEKYGMPLLHIKANTNNDDELDRIEEQAANFGSDGYLVTQAGDEATIVERKGDNMHKIYYDNILYTDGQSSKVSNGQTGTSDEKAFVGGAEVHERLLNDITDSRLTNITFTINDSVLPYLKRKGYIPEHIDEFAYDTIKAKEKGKEKDKPKDTPKAKK